MPESSKTAPRFAGLHARPPPLAQVRAQFFDLKSTVAIDDHGRTSPNLNLSLSAERLDGTVGEWGSADMSWSLNPSSQLMSRAWVPLAGHLAGAVQG